MRMNEARQLELTVVRSEPGGPPYRETVTAPVTETTTVLDLLEWAKAGPWPALAFRYSCRSGVCGSCGVMVNGRPVLACETNAFGYLKSGLTVGPLARIPVERDLITDVDGFINRLRQSKTWLIPATMPDAAATPENINRQTPAELEIYRSLSECINCLLCYAACPVFPALTEVADEAQVGASGDGTAASSLPKSGKTVTETDSGFIGPAALALARRWDLDSRDSGAEQRDEAVGEDEHGIWPCTQDGSCTRVCPKGLDPKAAINQLQRLFLT